MSELGQATMGSLSQQVRDALIHQIINGERQPGDRLKETDLASEFGTSQAPIREALRDLHRYSLVEIKPRRGTFVRPFLQQTLQESYVVRAALEEAATRLMLTRGSIPTTDLQNELDNMSVAAQKHNVEQLTEATVNFHRHIIIASDNALLRDSWESLHIRARTSIVMSAAELVPADVVTDHQQLFDALLQGDIDHACHSARTHQWQFADVVNKIDNQ